MKQLNVTINLPSKSFLFGLVAAILLILFSTSISTSTATLVKAPNVGVDTITGCLGNSNPANPGLILGSRIITPSTLLRVDPSGNCGANESSLTWNVQGPQGPQGPKGDPTYIRTIIVNNTNDATTDGNALLSAMTLISNASPSRTKSYLLKLEPGVYDIGKF